LRWLAGNFGDLEGYDFGVSDIPWALALIDEAFSKIMINGELLLDDDFMMSIFTPISNNIKPFKDYLLYMFEEKQSRHVSSRHSADKILHWDLLHAKVYYSNRKDILQSNNMCATLASLGASRFDRELRDETKTTAKYTKDLNGEKCRDNVLEEEKMALLGVDANNSISESLHTSLTYGLQQGGTILLDHCAAAGQTQANNNFGRQHTTLVKGQEY